MADFTSVNEHYYIYLLLPVNKSIIHKDYFNMRFILGEAFCWLLKLYTVLCEMWNDI